MKHLAGLYLFALSAVAQLPGQYPGSQYPTGRGQTIPLPGQRQPPPSQPSDRRSAPQTSRTETTRSTTTTGMLRKLASRQVIIESDDHRVIWYRIDSDIGEKGRPGDRVSVTSTSDNAGIYTATSFEWIGAGTAEDRAAAAQTWDLPSDDANRTERVRSGPMPTCSDDETIAQARRTAFEFIENLPNFIAKQSTTRYSLEGSRGNWTAVDVISANLVYRNGTEQYSDIRIGNKPVNKSMSEVGGLHTSGEFGSIIGGIFDPDSGTEFSRPTQVTERNHKAYVYKFQVPRERTEWRISAPSELYFAAYGGAIWIDAESNRVLRIEMQARNLPSAFPFDTVETNVDYDFVRLDSGKQFLLPTESEALNCVRGSGYCMRNSTSFRNYSKFESDSRIIFDDPPQ